jgi:hypothetical protein
MTNIDPWSMPNWVIYRYFPSARELDYGDFMPADQFVSLMEAVGFRNVSGRRTHRVTQENLGDFLSYASQRHRASQLMAISDEAYEAGITSIKDDLSKAESEGITTQSEFCLVTVIGEKA